MRKGGPLVAERRSLLEIAAVVATGVVFLVFENVLHRKLERDPWRELFG